MTVEKSLYDPVDVVLDGEIVSAPRWMTELFVQAGGGDGEASGVEIQSDFPDPANKTWISPYRH